MYQLKITGSKRARTLLWTIPPTDEGIEQYVKMTLLNLISKHKMKLKSAAIYTNAGALVRHFSHIIKQIEIEKTTK